MGTRNVRSNRFLKVLDRYEQVLVVTHDNPDPDAIAAGWAISWLIQERLAKRTRLIGGGDVVRAENRQMLRLLRPPIDLVRSIKCPPKTAVVLVDTGPGSENHLFTGHHVRPVAVIDHHLPHGPWRRLPYQDIRPGVAASATIAASYLREQRLVPSAELATALLYGVRTETSGAETHHTRLDRSVVRWLSERADPTRLAEIVNAPLSQAYFGDLVLALQSTLNYEGTALCLLPRASGPEIVGEVADLLIRCESIRRVLCGAVVHGDLVLSARTARGDEDATALLKATLEGIGQGGGHPHRAGGKISCKGETDKLEALIRGGLRTRWLAACGVSNADGQPLIPRHEIVKHL